LLPGIFTLERFVAEVRSRMESRLWRLLARDVSDIQRQCLDELLALAAEGHQSRFDQLRKMPVRVSAPALAGAARETEKMWQCVVCPSQIRVMSILPFGNVFDHV